MGQQKLYFDDEDDIFTTPQDPTPGQLIDLEQHQQALQRFGGQMPAGVLPINTVINGKVYYRQPEQTPGMVLRLSRARDFTSGDSSVHYHKHKWV